MTESTSEYKKRIEEIKQSIENEPYMAKMREDIAEGISKTGIRQATVEEQFQSVLDETTGKDVISAPEIILGRGAYPTLGERLDESDAQLQNMVNVSTQGASFVDKLLQYIAVKSMYVRPIIGGVGIGINLLDNLNSVIEYQFKYNGDGLLLLRGIYTGTSVIQAYPIPILNGTFVQASAPITYTTTVNDSFAFNFTGTGFIFKRRKENRGGLWQFDITDGTKHYSTKISCYSENTIEGSEDIVFSDLPKKAYKVKATFLGDDPFNPPSSSPSRGYLNYIESNLTSYTIRVIDDCAIIDDTLSRIAVTPSTIPDFAVSSRKNGATYAPTWCPVHGNVKDVSTGVAMKLIIDGTDRIAAANGILSTTYFNVKDIVLIQNFDAQNPNGIADGALWTHYVTHRININKPFCEISNKLIFLQDTKIDSMYLTMLGVDASQMSRLALNDGTEYNNIPTDGSDIALDNKVSSAMYVGEYTSGRTHGCAVDVLSYADATSERQIKISKPARITFRVDGVAKFYLNAFSGIATAGQEFSNTQRIIAVTGIKYPNNLLKSI